MTALRKKSDDVLLRWALDPACFVREALGAEPQKWQIEALEGIRDNDRVAIRSGRGVGKTAFLAWLVLWWVLTRPQAKVGITAPSGPQLNDALWPEVSLWARKLPEGLRKEITINSDRLYLNSAPDLNFATLRTARREQPEAFQGLHAKNMLFVVDEASGVDDLIFQAGEGAMSTKGAKTVLCGNPTRVSGYFYDCFHRVRSLWRTLKVSCLDSTLPTQAYIDSVKMKYGEASNYYRVHVLGEFPNNADDAVIPLHLIEEAAVRDVAPVKGPEVWGLDVARFGDDRTALAKRCANTLKEPIKFWQNKDVMQVAGLVKNEYDDSKIKPEKIYVDVIGLGAGVVDRMKELGLPVSGVNVSESPAVKDRFLRLRDELWFNAREWFFNRDCRIPKDEELIGELSLPTYDVTNSLGKVKVQSKDEIKKGGVRSPDLADSFILTFAFGGTVRYKPIAYPNNGVF